MEHPYTAQLKVAAETHLLGRKIVEFRHMTEKEAEDCGWDSRPPVLVLDDGNWICPMRDDEGNDGGAFATSFEGELETIGVIQ